MMRPQEPHHQLVLRPQPQGVTNSYPISCGQQGCSEDVVLPKHPQKTGVCSWSSLQVGKLRHTPTVCEWTKVTQQVPHLSCC